MSDIPELDDVLEHYGVKGMKWGVRRTREQLDRAAGRRSAKRAARKAERAPSPDAKRARELQSKAQKRGTNTLSNRELAELNKRLNLEQNYSNLTKPKGKSKRKISKFEKKMLDTAIDMGVKFAADRMFDKFNAPRTQSRNDQVARAIEGVVIDVEAKRTR